MWLRTVEAWPVLLMAAIANGAFRVGVLIPRLGDYRAHVVSTLMLAALILGMTVPIIDGIGIGSFPEAVVIGLVWVVLTLAFEFLAGHYFFGNSWERLLADYDVRHGRIWAVVLVTTFVSPLWALTRHHG